MFENTAAFPGTAAFTGSLADATAASGSAELVRRDLSGAPPVLSGTLEDTSASGEVPAGVVALAVPFDERWTMDVAGEEVPASVGFGALTSFDVATGGPAGLDYETSTSRHAELVGQALLWVAALVAASRLRRPGWTRRAAARGDRATVIELADDVELPTDAGDVPVLVPLEPVGATAGSRHKAERPLFRAGRSSGAGCLGRRHVRRRGRPGSGRCPGVAGSGRCPGVTAMNLRRLPMLVVTIAALVAVVLGAGSAVVPTSAMFSTVSAPWMPAAPLPGGLTSAWFCPGVPAAGEEGRTGIVAVFNSGEAALRGRLTVLRVDGEPVTQDIDVPPFDSQEFALDTIVESPYAAAYVEIDGGGGLVEQRAVDPAGQSVAACANASAREWYLAAGDTLDGSVERLVLSNPHDYPAVVDVTLATERGVRVPEQYQGFAVPAQSVRVIDVNSIIGDQTRIGVSVVASRGRVIVGRAQLLETPDRTGFVMTLAAPATRDQWWFAYGERADNVVENYYLYNPGDEDAEVTPVLLGFQQSAGMEAPATIVVPDGEVVEFRMADVADLPAEPHSVVFSTEPSTPIVVERVLTRTIDTVPTTSITLGATTRPDGYVATTWYVGLGPSVATQGASGALQQHQCGIHRHPAGDHPARRAERGRVRGHRRRPGGDPLPRHHRHGARQPADHPLDDAGVRRTGPAPGTGRPRPRRRLGRPRQRLNHPSAGALSECPSDPTAGSPALGYLASTVWIAC